MGPGLVQEVTSKQVSFYREHGFVVMESFLDDGGLAEWRRTVDEAVAERGRLAIPGFAEAPSGTYYDRVFTQRVNLWQTDDAVAKLVTDPRLGSAAAALAGVDGVRLYHDQALIKEPWANPTAFHLDVPYWAFTSADAVSVWVALDDATMQNGCLLYVPGSHKAEKFDNVGIGPELGALFSVYPEWANVTPVACPMQAGGAVWHNGLTAHGAGANMTPGRRRAMTAGFMPDGSTFNGTSNIYRPEQVARMKIGDALDDESQNPLVWQRSG